MYRDKTLGYGLYDKDTHEWISFHTNSGRKRVWGKSGEASRAFSYHTGTKLKDQSKIIIREITPAKLSMSHGTKINIKEPT